MLKSRKGDGRYLNSQRALNFSGVYEIEDYLDGVGKRVKLVDKGISRPNGVALSADGSTLYITETCTNTFTPSCPPSMNKIHQYSINLKHPSSKPKKVGVIRFHLDGVGHCDGLKVHSGTGLIVSSCPNGLCIIRPIVRDVRGELIAHVKLGEVATKISNIAFGRYYMYITGEKHVWRIKLAQ